MIVLKNYQQREKGLLREALTGLLPDDVLWRKKSPYPKTHHPAFFEKVRQQLLEILSDSSSPVRALLNCEKMRSFAELDTARSPYPWFGQLMGGPQLMAYLIQVDAWMRQNKVSIAM